MSAMSLAKQAIERKYTEIDIAIGVLWLLDKTEPGTAATPRKIAETIRDAGGAMPNITRLRKRIQDDPRSAKASPTEFRINARMRRELDEKFADLSGPIRPQNTGSVLGVEPFDKARRYTKNVLHQINASYDNALFDCCAVMCRRLFETLIIDAFDHQKELDLIKDKNGEILSLSHLINILGRQDAFRVGRQTKQAAMKLKNIGDWSAHNRTFIAQRSHIDGISSDLSVATMDLLHLSGQD